MKNIAAISTAMGESGIAIIRISGKDSKEILQKVFKPKSEKCKYIPNKMYFGEVFDDGEFVDNALGVFFKEPKSYTGENSAEIQCHGGTVVAERVLKAVLKNGATMAEPGEFTKRAFLNGKIDLSQAESVMDLISSLSEKSAAESAKNLKGRIYEEVNRFQSILTDVIAQVEAGIEYPEEDLEEVISEEQLKTLEPLNESIKELAKTYQNGKMLREGIKTAIAGKPNVGKSSLLNLILGEERAIVTKIAGTTRDILSEYFIYKSIPVVLMDTAGVRETEDEVEKIGVGRSIEAIEMSDVVLFVVDVSRKLEDEDMLIYEKLKNKKHITILNKTDLETVTDLNKIKEILGEDAIELSCKSGFGKEKILEKLYNTVVRLDNSENAVIMRERQFDALRRTSDSLTNAINAMKNSIDLDCVSIDLNEAWQALGEISGSTLSEKIIDRIFEKFCLGK